MARESRYDTMQYRRCGRSGLKLPAISLGLWQNFGDDHPFETQQGDRDAGRSTSASPTSTSPTTTARPTARRRRTSAASWPRTLRPTATSSSSRRRPATTCGPGPTATGARASTCWPRSTSRSARMGLDYVDIFYSHRVDPETPLEETMGALDTAVRQGKALYVGISSYSAERTRAAAEILRSLGTPLLIHQPSYSMLNRWIEPDLLGTLESSRRRLHRVLAARPGAPHRPLPRRRSRRTRARSWAGPSASAS